jgi:hypothetical protein
MVTAPYALDFYFRKDISVNKHNTRHAHAQVHTHRGQLGSLTVKIYVFREAGNRLGEVIGEQWTPNLDIWEVCGLPDNGSRSSNSTGTKKPEWQNVPTLAAADMAKTDGETTNSSACSPAESRHRIQHNDHTSSLC